MSACNVSGAADCALTITTVVGSTTAVGVTATSPITFSATGDLSLQSSTSVTGVAGSAFTLLADTDGINGGNLAFNGNADAGISSVTSVTSLVLSGDDLLLNTATGIAAGTAPVYIYQSVASGVSDGSILIGGSTLVADASGVLYINNAELNSIVTSAILTIGGTSTLAVAINDMSYTAGTIPQLLLLAGVDSTTLLLGTATGASITVTATASFSDAVLTKMMSSNTISFTASSSFTANGASGLIVIADVGCAGATGAVTIGAGSTLSTSIGSITLTGEDLIFGDSSTSKLTAATSATITNVCGGIELGGVFAATPSVATSMAVDSSELALITVGSGLTFVPATGSAGTITVVAVIPATSTASITGDVTLNAATGGAITFTAASTWSTSIIANSDAVITVDDASPIITNAGALTLSSTAASTTPAISVTSLTC